MFLQWSFRWVLTDGREGPWRDLRILQSVTGPGSYDADGDAREGWARGGCMEKSQKKKEKTTETKKRTNFGKEDRPVAEEQRRQDRRRPWGHRLLAGKFEGAAPPFDLLTV